MLYLLTDDGAVVLSTAVRSLPYARHEVGLNNMNAEEKRSRALSAVCLTQRDVDEDK